MADAAAMGPPNTYVFTGERSRDGYRLNSLSMTLADAGNRAAFLADEDGYMADHGLNNAEMDMVRRRDWEAMIGHGGCVYVIIKIAATVGINLLQMGAQMRGETMAEFMATRPGVPR